jgi:hypothetical protein
VGDWVTKRPGGISGFPYDSEFPANPSFLYSQDASLDALDNLLTSGHLNIA